MTNQPKNGRALLTGKSSSDPISRWLVPVLCLALAAITVAVFGQTVRHDFVDYDDNDYIVDNPVVTRGLTLKGLLWAFSFHSANWHPLTWLSHMLDCQLYGLNAGGHHLTSVLLHTTTVILLFLVLCQLTGAVWRSAFVAAVFAIHPLRAESVAWVAERKDVLSGLFFVLTIGAYVRYARRPRSRARFGLVVLLFALGLMSKPMLVTLPLVLLLLDYWPLRRTESTWRLVAEKLPLAALSAAACVATLLAQRAAMISSGPYSALHRLGNPLVSCVKYLVQMVWPTGLAPFYPYPSQGIPLSEVALAAGVLGGISAIVWISRRTRPWLLFGWIWYLVMLLPVIGIIQVGMQAHADRYTYLPQIGIYVAVTWLVAEWHWNRVILGSLMSAAVALLVVCGWRQAAYWKNGETLWTHALECTKDNAVAHDGLGCMLFKRKDFDNAILQFQMAVRLSPSVAHSHFNLGSSFDQKGLLDEAINEYETALKYDPKYADAHGNLGNVLDRKGRVDEAIARYEMALQINPDYADARSNLGRALVKKGRLDDGIDQYRMALHIKPDFPEAHNNLGNALVRKGKLDEAVSEYQAALRANPDYADAHKDLGIAFTQKGMVDQAITEYEAALRIKPDEAEIHDSLGDVLLKKGKMAEAIGQYEAALQNGAANVRVENNLAWVFATCADALYRNGKKAVELAQSANNQSGGADPAILDTLAAALAEDGRFDDAILTAQKALVLARAAKQQDLAKELEGELARYRAGLPCRQE